MLDPILISIVTIESSLDLNKRILVISDSKLPIGSLPLLNLTTSFFVVSQRLILPITPHQHQQKPLAIM